MFYLHHKEDLLSENKQLIKLSILYLIYKILCFVHRFSVRGDGVVAFKSYHILSFVTHCQLVEHQEHGGHKQEQNEGAPTHRPGTETSRLDQKQQLENSIP